MRALRDADLEVRRGEYLSIVGPSGSGKSSLLNVIALLDRHTDGIYRFEGTDVTELSEGARTGLRAHRIGFVFQSFHLLAHRTVTENVIMSMLYNSVPRRERRALAMAALDRVGLGHRAGFRPTRPAILICDEPTGNLDSSSTESVLELFDDLRSDGLTLLVVTHDDAVSARAERIVRMHDGRLSEPVAV